MITTQKHLANLTYKYRPETEKYRRNSNRKVFLDVFIILYSLYLSAGNGHLVKSKVI